MVLFFGIAQKQLVPGDWHWTIQVTHVVISMGAVWWGRRPVSLMRRREATVAAITEPDFPFASAGALAWGASSEIQMRSR